MKTDISKLMIGNASPNINDNEQNNPNLLNSYWAGFIAADGYVRLLGEKSAQIGITLAKKDENGKIIEIRNSIDNNVNIRALISNFFMFYE